MKKLKTADIKAIIAQKGSNSFEVVVGVPRDIFSHPIEIQKSIVALEVIGFELDVVKSIMFGGAVDDRTKMGVRATLEFSESVLEELAAMEVQYHKSLLKAPRLSKAITFEEAQALAEKDHKTFIFVVETVRISQLYNLKLYLSMHFIENMEIEITSANIVSVEGANTYVEVYIPEFKQFVNNELLRIHTLQSIIAPLEVDDFVYLPKPLDADDVEIMAQEHLSMIEDEENEEEEDEEDEDEYTYSQEFTHIFNYLVEIPYHILASYDEMEVEAYLCSRILNESECDGSFEVFEHEGVAFNPFTKSVIVRVSGEILFEIEV